MSKTFSDDGRFYIDYAQRSSDSYLYSDTSYSWKVHWTKTDRVFASYSGSWDQSASGETRAGTRSVSFSKDGRELVIVGFDGVTTRRPLPPPAPKELRATGERIAAWEAHFKAPGAATAVVDWGQPVTLFGRDISLKFRMTENYALPGRGSAEGSLVELAVGEHQIRIPPGPNLRECDGLRIAVDAPPASEGVRIAAIEIGPSTRHPVALAREEFDAFAAAARRVALPWKKPVKIEGRSILLTSAMPCLGTTYVEIVVDQEEVSLRAGMETKECRGLRLGVREVAPGDYQLCVLPAGTIGPPAP